MGDVKPALRFEALDSWRGLCALWVVLYHFRAVSHVYGWTWVRTGDIAVDFFFVLSGFVITHAYGQSLTDGTSRLRFLVRRFGRLYPLHIATLAAVVLMELARWAAAHQLGHQLGRPAFSGDTDLAALVPNILLVHALGVLRDFTWNVPSWSISVEWCLCLLYVVLSLWRRPLVAAGILAALGFAVTVWMTSLTQFPPEGYTAVVRGVYGFFLGVLAYRLFLRLREAGVTLPGWLEWTAPVLLALTVLFKEWRLFALQPPLFAALVLIFAAQAGPVSRLLKQRALTWLGEISYSIYLVHYVLVLAIFGGMLAVGAVMGFEPLLAYRNTLLLKMPNPWIGDLAAIGFLALTIGVAALTYRWIETPGRRWFNARAAALAPATNSGQA
jgi:peptidoglycan/LPS O-acetylase OafA/YrhL